ncbi:MAG: hypothetical protein Q4A24_06415 [Akkermansia sp.]|nr:hypothetical protein [Akkermansia sp.]
MADRPLVHARKSGGSPVLLIVIVVLLVMGGIFFYVVSGGGKDDGVADTGAEETSKVSECVTVAEPEIPDKQSEKTVNTPPRKKKPVAGEPEKQPARKTPAVTTEKPPVAEEEPPAESEETEEQPAEVTEPEGEETEEETADEEADGTPLVFGEGAADEEARMENYLAHVRTFVAEEDYEGLRESLKTALLAAYAPVFEKATAPSKKKKTDEAALPSPYASVPEASKLKVKDKLGRKAMADYYCVELVLATQAATQESLQKEFLEFMLTDESAPADAFFKGVQKRKVSAEMASEMLVELQVLYSESPRKAYKAINSVTASANKPTIKKYYPIDKKEIEKRIADILKTRPEKGADKAQQEAINLANVYRFVCGVAPTLKYDPTFGKQAEEAAAACARAGHIAHDLGHFTDACNLHSGMDARVKSVPGYIQDPGGPNRQARGHRNWILDPAAAKTAFGQSGHFHAMRVMDTSSPVKQKNAYSYPGRGYFPVRYMHGDGWSYYAPPGKTVEGEPKVEIWRLIRAPKKTVSASDLRDSRAVSVKEVFVNGRYLVFEPDYDDKAFLRDATGNPAGIYWIRVSWSGFRDEYLVEFY